MTQEYLAELESHLERTESLLEQVAAKGVQNEDLKVGDIIRDLFVFRAIYKKEISRVRDGISDEERLNAIAKEEFRGYDPNNQIENQFFNEESVIRYCSKPVLDAIDFAINGLRII